MIQVCNFADETTFYVCEKNLNTLINRVGYYTALAVEWFQNNCMKLNQDKCHLLVFPRTYHVCSTSKRYRNARFHVFLTWNTRGVFVGFWT